jgi:hypothetical protein
MSNAGNSVSEAQILASLIKRSGSMNSWGASVQRSHRFPLLIFTQIENMSRMANVSISMIINQLLEAGLESVHQHLTEDESNEIRQVSSEQVNRPLKQLKEDSIDTKSTSKKRIIK